MPVPGDMGSEFFDSFKIKGFLPLITGSLDGFCYGINKPVKPGDDPFFFNTVFPGEQFFYQVFHE
jgi:hypothetical protein